MRTICAQSAGTGREAIGGSGYSVHARTTTSPWQIRARIAGPWPNRKFCRIASPQGRPGTCGIPARNRHQARTKETPCPPEAARRLLACDLTLSACTSGDEPRAYLAKQGRPVVTAPGMAGPVSASDFPVPPPPLTEGVFPCNDCHNQDDRDFLRLAGGRLVPFTESYRLCGQCHGDKYRDWRVGVHGRRTGAWNGRKEYLLCVACHNPHAPRFKPITPMPPPLRPDEIKWKG